MKLSEWIKREGKTDAWLATAIGRDRSFVTKLRHGKKRPSLTTMEQILAATGGEVMPSDFLEAAR